MGKFKMKGWSGWSKSPLKKEPGSFTIDERRRGDEIRMDEWGDPSPKTWDEEAGAYVTPSHQEDPMLRESFMESQTGRVTDDKGLRGLKGLETSSGDPLLGRATVAKGTTDDDNIEKYVEGKNIAKTTRREKGSLDVQRDKVKQKKKGYVRKTGEGFLGLENRKKYVDGVEQTKENKKKIKEENKAKKQAQKEIDKKKRQENKKKRQQSSNKPRKSTTSTQAAKYKQMYG